MYYIAFVLLMSALIHPELSYSMGKVELYFSGGASHEEKTDETFGDFDRLPDEVLTHIFSYLDKNDRINTTLVNKKLHDVTEDLQFIRSHYQLNSNINEKSLKLLARAHKAGDAMALLELLELASVNFTPTEFFTPRVLDLYRPLEESKHPISLVVKAWKKMVLSPPGALVLPAFECGEFVKAMDSLLLEMDMRKLFPKSIADFYYGYYGSQEDSEKFNSRVLTSIYIGLGHGLNPKFSYLAAKEGHVVAYYQLGEFLYGPRPLNLPRSERYQQAFKYFSLAAQEDIAPAQYRLGLMYFEGHGVSQDFEEAHRYFSMAADQQDRESLLKLAGMYRTGTGVQRDIHKAIAFYRRVGEMGWGEKFYDLGKMYKTGIEVNQNFSEAFGYFCRAAELGYSDALYEVATLYRDGFGTESETEKAFDQFSLRSELDVSELKENAFKCADMHAGQEDEQKGLDCFRESLTPPMMLRLMQD
jgi:TPR repeat protein